MAFYRVHVYHFFFFLCTPYQCSAIQKINGIELGHRKTDGWSAYGNHRLISLFISVLCRIVAIIVFVIAVVVVSAGISVCIWLYSLFGGQKEKIEIYCVFFPSFVEHNVPFNANQPNLKSYTRTNTSTPITTSIILNF